MTFTISLLAPTVTLSQTKTPSNNTKPSFSGTSSEKALVTLKVYAGTKVEGSPVATKTAAVENGTWKVSEVPLATGKHTYTAVASEPSEIGNSPGESAHDVFEVNTEPPTVTLNPVAEVSSDTTPLFSGTASDTTIVTVKIFSGEKAEGTPVRTLKAQPSGGTWTSPVVNPELKNGKYTATASQPSSLENPEGVSGPVHFEVNTESPLVTLNQPPKRSREAKLSFSGTASEATQVTIEVHKGESTSGQLVKEAVATGTRSAWTSNEVTLPIGPGENVFTAVAVQTSALKNVPGKSAPVTFVIDTEPPAVTLNQPPSPSNDLTPSFSGTSNEDTQVMVHVYEGTAAEDKVVATATATPSNGSWTTNETSRLPEGSHTFTAVATELSGIAGNSPGTSASVTFAVDTLSPTVTLNPVESQGDAKASFSGTASEIGPVTIDIYAGAQASGREVASLTAAGTGAQWISGQLEKALDNGQYTAIASQQSGIGNSPGTSAPVTFTVNTSPPTVDVESPSAVKNTSALLNASINPNDGHVSSCSFEIGTTAAYGTLVECAFSIAGNSECSFAHCAFPFGASGVPVYARVFELKPSTTYYYRLVAENERGAGSATGTVTTAATRPVSGPITGAAPTPAASSAATGVAASKSAELAALIGGELIPSGRAAKIAALLKTGAYKERFKAPAAGTASIKWYYLPPGTKLGGKGRHAPVLVASGSARFSAAGVVATIKVRLTAVGRRLLSHAMQMRLTATCVFTSTGKAATTVSRKFELKR
jgi:hypothetical protein